ncbi:MAG: hypothetical protein V1674_02495 [Candidatus Omnitrophota bacterium]
MYEQYWGLTEKPFENTSHQLITKGLFITDANGWLRMSRLSYFIRLNPCLPAGRR